MKIGKFDLRGNLSKLKWTEWEHKGITRRRAIGTARVPEGREDKLINRDLGDDIWGDPEESDILKYCKRVGIKREEFYGTDSDNSSSDFYFPDDLEDKEDDKEDNQLKLEL